MKLGDKLQQNLDTKEEREEARREAASKTAIEQVKNVVSKKINDGETNIEVTAEDISDLDLANSSAVYNAVQTWGFGEGLRVVRNTRYPIHHYIFQVLR